MASLYLPKHLSDQVSTLAALLQLELVLPVVYFQLRLNHLFEMPGESRSMTAIVADLLLTHQNQEASFGLSSE